MAITGGVDSILSRQKSVQPLSDESKARVTRVDPVQRIFWAIDLDSSHTQTTINDLRHAAKIISQVFPKAKIYPAHVIDPEGLAWNGESLRDRSQRLHPMVQNALDEVVKEATYNELENVAKPFVIDSSEAPIQGTGTLAKRLASWATKFHADLILTFSSKRSGLVDLLAPSFTDHLLSESKLPILVINSHTKVRLSPITDLVFATNFTETCRNTFLETLAWAEHFKASLRLFNKPEAHFAPAVYGTSTLFGSGWSGLPPDGLSSELIESESELWLKRAELDGIKATFERDSSGLGTAQAIDAYCSHFSHPLLIMSTCHGPLETGLWGSVTRDVLHQSSAPVLILRG